jgi:predicted Fe-Mo cluster-binding NifX family protein
VDIILVVEDKTEEQKKAKEAVVGSGFKIVIASTLSDAERLMGMLKDKISGIITDIHFPEQEDGKENNPCGIAVIVLAIQKNIPVVVCSDINSHSAGYLETVVRGLEKFAGRKIPFVMNRKNWDESLDKLKEIKES